MTGKEKARKQMSAIIAVALTAAMVAILMLALFGKDEYARFLPMVVFLSGLMGLVNYLNASEDEDEEYL